MRQKRKVYLVGIIILLLIIGGVFLYKQSHTIKTVPYHASNVPSDKRGPAILLSPTTTSSGSSSNTGTSITQTAINPTPVITLNPQSTQVVPQSTHVTPTASVP